MTLILSLMRPLAVILLLLSLGACSALQPAGANHTDLDFQIYNPQQQSMFAVTSTLISGPSEAILFDAQFQQNDAQQLVNMVLASGKKLTTIYISHADPDYYFGLDVLTTAFPQARVVATPATVAKISQTMAGKKAYWGPILKDNAPTRLVLPQPLSDNKLTVDGETIEIIGMQGHDPLHTFAWLAAEKTVVGGVVLMENMHLWMADAKTPAEREAWLTTLDRMAELQPERVIAGHFIGRTKADSRVIEFNREYLRTFNRLAGNSKTAAELIAGMKQAYPQLAEEKTLEFSAGVVKGDIRWPQ